MSRKLMDMLLTSKDSIVTSLMKQVPSIKNAREQFGHDTDIPEDKRIREKLEEIVDDDLLGEAIRDQVIRGITMVLYREQEAVPMLDALRKYASPHRLLTGVMFLPSPGSTLIASSLTTNNWVVEVIDGSHVVSPLAIASTGLPFNEQIAQTVTYFSLYGLTPMTGIASYLALYENALAKGNIIDHQTPAATILNPQDFLDKNDTSLGRPDLMIACSSSNSTQGNKDSNLESYSLMIGHTDITNEHFILRAAKKLKLV